MIGKSRPFRGRTVIYLEMDVRFLRERLKETEDELSVAEAALSAAKAREKTLTELKDEGKQ